MHWLVSVENFSLSPLYDKGSLLLARNNNVDNKNLKIKSILSSYGSIVYGNDKFFKPNSQYFGKIY